MEAKVKKANLDESFDLQLLEMTRPKEKIRRTDAETDSGISDSLLEVTTDAKKARNAGKCKALIRYCISHKKCIITAVTSIIIAIISIIVSVVLVTKEKPCPICAPCERFACPDSWIVYEGKYFYVSKEKRNWLMSSKMCSSINASLAVIDTQKELDSCAYILGSDDYWFGLSKKDQVWKWPNGTEFTNQFPVGGEGFCAYVHGKGADSTICSAEKRFLCSLPESCHKAG